MTGHYPRRFVILVTLLSAGCTTVNPITERPGASPQCGTHIECYNLALLKLAETRKLLDNYRAQSEARLATLLPAGTVVASATSFEPDGWLICNGRSVSAAKYPELEKALKERYGPETRDASGNPTAFHLPDYRGMFLRGANNDRTPAVDPGIFNRKPPPNGSGQPNEVGSTQEDAIGKHRHVALFNGDCDTSQPSGFYLLVGCVNRNPTGFYTGDPPNSEETRPKNTYVNYLIKAH